MTVAANLPKPPSEHPTSASIDPAVLQGIRQASRSTNVDFGYLMAQAAQESSFQADAKATTSSATGLFQFIDSTWLDTMRQHGAQHGLGQLAQQITTDGAGRPVVADPAARERILALRKDPGVSAAMAAELAKSNKAEVERALGRPAHSTDLYLAHFLGASGATELLKAVQQNGATPAASLLPEAAAANRAVFFDAQSGEPRTVADLYRNFAARVEHNAAGYAPLGGGGDVAVSAVSGGGASTWLSAVSGSKGLVAPISSVFNALMMTALKLIGGGSDAQKIGALPDMAGIAAPAGVRRRDDGVA
jgi:hypothetical protein